MKNQTTCCRKTSDKMGKIYIKMLIAPEFLGNQQDILGIPEKKLIIKLFFGQINGSKSVDFNKFELKEKTRYMLVVNLPTFGSGCRHNKSKQNDN